MDYLNSSSDDTHSTCSTSSSSSLRASKVTDAELCEMMRRGQLDSRDYYDSLLLEDARRSVRYGMEISDKTQMRNEMDFYGDVVPSGYSMIRDAAAEIIEVDDNSAQHHQEAEGWGGHVRRMEGSKVVGVYQRVPEYVERDMWTAYDAGSYGVGVEWEKIRMSLDAGDRHFDDREIEQLREWKGEWTTFKAESQEHGLPHEDDRKRHVAMGYSLMCARSPWLLPDYYTTNAYVQMDGDDVPQILPRVVNQYYKMMESGNGITEQHFVTWLFAVFSGETNTNVSDCMLEPGRKLDGKEVDNFGVCADLHGEESKYWCETYNIGPAGQNNYLTWLQYWEVYLKRTEPRSVLGEDFDERKWGSRIYCTKILENAAFFSQEPLWPRFFKYATDYFKIGEDKMERVGSRDISYVFLHRARSPLSRR